MYNGVRDPRSHWPLTFASACHRWPLPREWPNQVIRCSAYRQWPVRPNGSRIYWPSDQMFPWSLSGGECIERSPYWLMPVHCATTDRNWLNIAVKCWQCLYPRWSPMHKSGEVRLRDVLFRPICRKLSIYTLLSYLFNAESWFFIAVELLKMLDFSYMWSWELHM